MRPKDEGPGAGGQGAAAHALALIALVFVFAPGLLSACASSPAPPPPVFTRAPTQVNAAAASETPAPSAPPATGTASPRPTSPPTPTSTPAPVLRQLTTGGCCVQPFWSPDGNEVWFIDRPGDAQPAGVWGVPASGGEPRFVTDRLGVFSPDGSLIAYPRAGATVVERLADGEAWRVPADGRAVLFSPDSAQIAWQTASSTLNFDRRIVEVWAAAVDGSGARVVARLIGGALLGWFPDSARLLVVGREAVETDPVLGAVDVASGVLSGIVRTGNVRGAVVSPEGGWLVYQVAFSGDPLLDGIWITRVDGGNAVKVRAFGAYRWRAEGRLLLVPLEPGAASHRLVEIDAGTGIATPLTDPAVTAFRIAAGDWALAPDGGRLVFVSAVDRNLWVLELPP